MASKEQLTATVNIIASLIRSVHLKRVLSDFDPDPGLNFWRVMHGNLLDMAVLDWCKLFGSDDEEHQKTHWKNVVADEEQFRKDLLKAIGVDAGAWKTYWNDMKNYRDQHVAHRDFGKPDVTHYPKLDLALESSYFYYGYLIAELRKIGVKNYPDDIRDYCNRFSAQAKNIAEKALTATKSLQETVY